MTDLSFHIRQYVPDATGEELEHRKALMKARDYAAALRGQTLGQLAYSHACDAHEMAGEFVFAPVPIARLDLAVKYCRHIVMAAFLADHLEGEGGGA